MNASILTFRRSAGTLARSRRWQQGFQDAAGEFIFPKAFGLDGFPPGHPRLNAVVYSLIASRPSTAMIGAQRIPEHHWI